MATITTLGLLTRRSMSSPDKGRQLFELFQAAAPDLVPRKYDVTEPIRRVFDPSHLEDASNLWGGSPTFFWTTVRGGLGSYFEGVSRNTLDVFHVSIERDDFDAHKLLEPLRLLSVKFQVEFAYVHVSFEEDLQDRAHYRTRVMPFCQGLSAPAFEKKLPGVAWAMCFGEDYLKHTGRERVLSAPVHAVLPLSDGGVFVQVTGTLNHYHPDAESFREASRVLIQHLGERFIRSG